MIKVGLKTLGFPQIEKEGEVTLLRNMLIGDGFHWQQSISVRLPGEIEILSEKEAGQNVSIINTLPLETYLECVVGSEMNPHSPAEFLKAHAVISRSWVAGKIRRLHQSSNDGFISNESTLIGWDDTSSHTGFHVCSDDHCQRYQGLQPIADISRDAIRQTAGEVIITPDNSILDTRFSKCCGGKTELFSTCWQPMDFTGLESFDDPWCDLSDLTPASRRSLLSSVLKDYDCGTEGHGFHWQTTVSKKEIARNLKNRFERDLGEIISVNPLHRGPSGRIDLLHIKGTKGSLNLGKELWIRRILSPTHLYSSAFEIEDRGETLVLTGKGWGHGVGLCQIGAARMATAGYDYRRILSFYYPHTRIGKIP